MNEYIVDPILPAREVHLLAGPSGAGKTRWLMHTLLEWEQGLPVLEFFSYPVPWVYVAADRSIVSVNRTLTGMGIKAANILTIAAWDHDMGINEIFDKIKASGAKLAVWESFGSFVDEPAQGRQVKKHLCRAASFCRQYDVTIIGIVESPKQKPYEKYENPRQRVSGAAAWAHFAETILLVEPDHVSEVENPDRTLYVCPRNAPGMKIALAFDLHGRLLPIQQDSVEDVIDRQLKKGKKGRNRL